MDETSERSEDELAKAQREADERIDELTSESKDMEERLDQVESDEGDVEVPDPPSDSVPSNIDE